MEPLPGPPPLPVIGNLLDLDLKNTIQSWLDLADVHGPIYKLRLRGVDRIFITGYELINEICSRKDFVKRPLGVIKSLRDITPDGLLTADHGQESWELAHRTLVPAFGPLAIQDMFEEMHDIACQMVLRWARFGDDSAIDVSADFTRLTLDTIALCAMETRFNSFYKESLHPFVGSMISALSETQYRSVRPPWLSRMFWNANKAFEDNNALMHEIALEVIARRRAYPSGKKDLLNAMLKGKDPVTGKGLSDEVIVDNMIIFLIAGHETTSALLSFLFAMLLKYPKVLDELRREVDTVLGTGPMTAKHLKELPYTKACLRETLRLHSPVAGFALCPWKEDETPAVLGKKYHIEPDAGCMILLQKMHRDPSIYGDDAESFRPERMAEEKFKRLPPNSFKPFGHGSRACIGSDFAIQEATIATAILIQKFDFRLVDPNYVLRIRQTATVKPENLFMYAKLRRDVDILTLQRDLFSHNDAGSNKQFVRGSPEQSPDDLQPMSIFYGSNTGSCERLAEQLEMSALQRGFRCTVKPLNQAEGALPAAQPIIIISSTHYEGQPPDNAAKFLAWLSSIGSGSLEGVNYAVYGCGNRDWKDTFQAIPIQIDQGMEKAGGMRLAARGTADAGEGNISGDFDTWQADYLWPAISRNYHIQATAMGLITRLRPSIDDPAISASHSSHPLAKVLEVRALTGDEDRPKYHMEIQLPQGISYQVGDYLEVVPRNSQQTRDRLLAVLRARHQDLEDPLAVAIYTQFELNQPASANQLQSLVEQCADASDKATIETLDREVWVMNGRRPSILDLLDAYQTIKASLADLVSLLSPIRPRLYSISSSPLLHSNRCTLTWSLMMHESTPASAGLPNGPSSVMSRGLASDYLASLSVGDNLPCSVRAGQDRFRPPADTETPIIMICAGSGVAPFRGFVQEREELLRNSPLLQERLGKAILYIGCRSPSHAPYAAELRASRTVEVIYTFSRQSEDSRGCKYVHDAVWADRQELAQLWEMGARVYVCGGHPVSQSIKETVRRIYREVAEARCGPKGETDVEQWWVESLRDQYSVDVF